MCDRGTSTFALIAALKRSGEALNFASATNLP